MTAPAVDDEPAVAQIEQQPAEEQNQDANGDATKVAEQAAAEDAAGASAQNTPAADNVEQKQVEQDNQTQD